MVLWEAHSEPTVRNQAGPAGSELSMGGIRGLGKKERDRRRRNMKREVRKMFKVVTGADLQGQVEFLAAEVEKQAGIIDVVHSVLLQGWGCGDAVQTWGNYLCDNEGISEAERDLRRRVFASAADEARRRMARRQAHKEVYL